LQPNNVLVTGSSGFVGGNLVEALLKRGCSVTCLVRNSSKAHTFLQKLGAHLVFGDLSDAATLRKAVSGVDKIFHIAGAIKASNRQQYFEVNQLGTRRLLEAAAEANPNLSRFIHMSSLSAAGPSKNGHKLREDEEPNPISWYGESKLESEREVLKFANVYPVTILRPSAVYGQRDMETLVIFRMIKSGWLFTPGTSSRRFSMIHVADLSESCIRAGELNTPSGEIFYIARPEAYAWEDVANSIAQALAKHYVRIPLPKWTAMAAGLAGDLWSVLSGKALTVNSQKTRELLQPFWLCDSSKALKYLGFNPAIDLSRGIRETVIWYQNKGYL
jgi:nucleoside-diphosphate-sugar epimerase